MSIVPVSNWLRNIVQQSFLSDFPLQVINNGIDLELFKDQNNTEEIRSKYKIGKRFILLGVATAWSEKKGLHDYINLSKVLTDDFVIMLVGLTKSQLNELPDSIIGLSRTENISELAKLYTAADTVLNLSAEESFGLTTVEGFACGTPGIVYNCTASPELITPSTGFVVEKGNIQDLVSAIDTIKSKGKGSYSLACRERAEKCYNKNDRYMDYIKLYKSLIQ
jgi:glycosyltransferase involved in cell wall biosynthesis